MVGIGRIIALATLSGTLAGCHRDRFQWDGRWVGTLSAGRDSAAVIENTLARVDLTIRGERFELFLGGVPRAGRVRLRSDSARLETTTVLGRPIAQESPQVQALAADIELAPAGKDQIRLTLRDAAQIILRREAQP